MKKIKLTILFILYILVITTNFNGLAFDINSKAAILIDTKTNTVIYQKNINEKISPGAFAKLMTAIVVSENAGLDDKVTITAQMTDKFKNSTTYVRIMEGEILSVKDLLYCMILDSSNLAAYALALHTGSSEEEFAKLMNVKAQMIGATNTNFVNSHGYHDQHQYSTIWDCYIMSEYAARNQQLMDILNSQQYTIEPNNLRTKDTLFYTNNHLVSRFKSIYYYYSYARGIISGYTDESGYIISSTASMNKAGMNLFFVSAGGEKTDNNMLVSFADAKSAFEQAFSKYSIRNVVKSGQQVSEAKLLLSLERDYVPIVTKGDVSVVMPKDVKADQLEYKINVDKEIKAPVKIGDELGVYEVYYEGKLLGISPLTTNIDISSSFFLIFNDFVIGFFTNPVSRVLFILFVIALVSYILITIRINKRRSIFRSRSNNKFKN